jgi:hypothetical protein
MIIVKITSRKTFTFELSEQEVQALINDLGNVPYEILVDTEILFDLLGKLLAEKVKRSDV